MRDLAKELQDAARAAAGPVTAGMSIQAQVNRACINLGYPLGHWRVMKAWYGLAGNWRATAVFDFLDRYHRYLAKVARAAPAEPHRGRDSRNVA